MSNRLTVDAISDIICPWCFIGKRRLERAATIMECAIDIRWHPFQLNPEMPAVGVSRRDYRVAKFGSWEYSAELDSRVAENGRQVGLEFRHDLMTRTPNTFRGHVLLAAALRQGVDVQKAVAERLFTAYFTQGEDVGDEMVLTAIAKTFDVHGADDPALPELVRSEEKAARAGGVQGVPLITYRGKLVSAGAAPEDVLAATLRELASESEVKHAG